MNWKKDTLLFFSAGFILAAIIGAYFLFFNKQSLISGTFNINGVIPDGSTISVLVKQQGTANFQTVLSSLPATDNDYWHWNQAWEGKVYEIKAQLVANGKTYGESGVVQVVAPTRNQNLTIQSTYQPSTPTAQYGPISGTIDLNGALGSQNSITLYERKVGENDFTIVSQSIQAVDGVSWNWDGALAGSNYEVKATLFVNGLASGDSQTLPVTAPATSEVLRINSTYQAPPEKVSISGTVVLNGPIPANSTLSIYAQGPNDTSLVQVLSGLGAVNGTSWTWSNALQGYAYHIKASVLVDGADKGDSQIVSITAPASNEVLTINFGTSGNPTNQPPNSPTFQCQSQSNGQWTGTLTYQSVNGANSYWLEVGNQAGGTNILNTRVQWTGQGTQTYTLNTINNNTTYFAQYAASTCSTCSGINQFSPFSNMLQFSCATQSPSATPTQPPPPPTYTPYPTFTPPPATPTLTPSPTLPPQTSGCNQTCGSNGYSCAIGLQCATGSMPGSQACRNPNCTAQTDCTCN